jgi:Zn-finger nucleic acid-binding protein
MEKVSEPDITTDVCPSCGGVWLDKSELNVLATGMAGDIEYCSIDQEKHADRFPVRKCPKCSDQDMSKVNLLGYSEIIFDFCPTCNGFFLDKGEMYDTNIHLAGLTQDEIPDEYRGHLEGHLVTSKRVSDVVLESRFGLGLMVEAKPVDGIRISVYLKKPLDMGLRVYSAKWNHKFLKRLGLFRKQDIEAGYSELDNAYIIQGDDEQSVKALFKRSALRNELVQFAEQRPKIFNKAGSLEITDARAMYSEGPYVGNVKYDVKTDSSGIVRRLLKLVTLIESS